MNMNKQQKTVAAQDAGRMYNSAANVGVQALAALAALAVNRVLAKYLRDAFQSAMLIDELERDKFGGIEPVADESDVQHEKRLAKAQAQHEKRVAARVRQRVSRAFNKLEKVHGVEVPRDARGGGANAKGGQTGKAETEQAETAETGNAETGKAEQASTGKGADTIAPVKITKPAQQVAIDTLLAAVARHKPTDERDDVLLAVEKVAAFLKLDSGLK